MKLFQTLRSKLAALLLAACLLPATGCGCECAFCPAIVGGLAGAGAGKALDNIFD